MKLSSGSFISYVLHVICPIFLYGHGYNISTIQGFFVKNIGADTK